jgi:hypothetical protein
MYTHIIQGEKGIAYTLIDPRCERGNIFMMWDEEDARTKKSSAPCINHLKRASRLHGYQTFYPH